jgi:hypothetical protein
MIAQSTQDKIIRGMVDREEENLAKLRELQKTAPPDRQDRIAKMIRDSEESLAFAREMLAWGEPTA